MTPQELIDRALKLSRADGCVVVVTTNDTANIRWANTTVTTSGATTGWSWYVVSFVGTAAGSAESTSSDPADIASVVRSAEQEARDAGPAQDAQPLIEGAADDDFALPPARSGFDVYDALIPSLGDAFDQARRDDTVLYGFARHELATVYLGSSTGLRKRCVQPTGTVELNAKSSDLSRSAWAGQSTDDFRDVNVRDISASLSKRLDWARRSVPLAPGRYDTVLPGTSVADLMVYLAWIAGGRAAHEGRSAFSKSGGGTRVGERLTDLPLSLFTDPQAAPVQSAPFLATAGSSDEVSVFDNGAPITRSSVLTDGAISGLFHTRASAAEFGEPFSPIADNLVLTGGDPNRSIDDLVGDVRHGLLVTSMWYIRMVDPMTLLLTGLTRDGVYLVENGEVTGVVNNFRWNMSPLDVLRQTADAGATVRCLSREWSDWFTRSLMPPLRIDGFNMSSASQAQ